MAILSNVIPSFACDICGCYLGILYGEKQNAIAVYYRYRAFTGQSFKGNSWYPDNGNLRVDNTLHGSSGGAIANTNSFEIYRVSELRAKYFIHPKIEWNIIMPYLMNSDADGSTVTRLSGMGDITSFVGYDLFDNSFNNIIRQKFQLGAGIKLPTAKFNRKINDNRSSLLLQTGTGSTDAFVFGNYVLGYKKWGADFNLSYKMNGTNKFGEKIANSITSFSSLFYKFSLNKNVIILPNLQSYYENTDGLMINKVVQGGTAMKVWMLGGGLDVHYKKISLSASLQLPVREELVHYQPKSTLRTVFGLTWHFETKKFLISSNSQPSK